MGHPCTLHVEGCACKHSLQGRTLWLAAGHTMWRAADNTLKGAQRWSARGTRHTGALVVAEHEGGALGTHARLGGQGEEQLQHPAPSRESLPRAGGEGFVWRGVHRNLLRTLPLFLPLTHSLTHSPSTPTSRVTARVPAQTPKTLTGGKGVARGTAEPDAHGGGALSHHGRPGPQHDPRSVSGSGGSGNGSQRRRVGGASTLNPKP
ncbi:hypothetical protein T484DRAFT_3401906 [Baffinella frigidus]|nr:hypothetical protein T484DRAFT_3401906 [Cryptophyta sp. CCMP2293]